MKIEKIYTGCLPQEAYYIESAGEAAIIDPLLGIRDYIKATDKRQVRIKYIFETRFHADLIFSHQTLSAKTGASVVFGPNAIKLKEHAVIAKDGELFKIGNVKIKAIHTPGHTLESTCYLLINEAGKEEAIFTGNTLLFGEVGHPDVAQKAFGELVNEKMAAYLYDSLREKILPLPDDLIIYPAHGSGSACGKNRSKNTSETLGSQKKQIMRFGICPSQTLSQQ